MRVFVSLLASLALFACAEERQVSPRPPSADRGPDKESATARTGCGLDGHSCGNGYCCGAEEMCGDGKNGCAAESCCFIGPTNRRLAPPPAGGAPVPIGPSPAHR